MEKWLFFLVAMARLGKCCMGSYGVCRDNTLYNLEVKDVLQITSTFLHLHLSKSWTLSGQNHGPFLIQSKMFIMTQQKYSRCIVQP